MYYPYVSGLVTSIKMLYEGLENLGHECYIFTSMDLAGHDNDPELTEKRVINFDGIRYPFQVAKQYKFTPLLNKCAKQVKEYDLDIIHVQSEFGISLIARTAAEKYHIPIVHTLHTAWADYACTIFPTLDKINHPFCVWLMRNFLTMPNSKAATLEILPTKKMLPRLKEYGIVHEHPEITPTGIELERFNYESVDEDEISALRDKLGLKDKFVFVYVGRIVSEKSVDFLVDAYAKGFKDRDDVRFLIVGDGWSGDEVRKQAHDLGLDGKVIFTGEVEWEDVPMYYHLGDVFICASMSETQGLTYIEAMASGLPNIVKKDPCIDGVIKDGENGYLFDTEEEMIEKMNYVLDHREELGPLSEKAVETSLLYSKEAFARNVLRIYEKAIDIYKNDGQDH